MIIVDTGAWVALTDRGDRYHQSCKSFFRNNRDPLITTYAVLVETVHLLYNRVGVPMTLAWLSALRAQNFALFTLNAEHFPRLISLMQQYADLPMDLTDASLVILAEHLGHGRIASTDERDFRAYRWKTRHPFVNVLKPPR